MLAALHRSLVDAPFAPFSPLPPLNPPDPSAAATTALQTAAAALQTAAAALPPSVAATPLPSLGAAGVAAAACPAAVQTATASLAGAAVTVLFLGEISNQAEVASLYGAELDDGGADEAALVLDLYLRGGGGFCDVDGDASDQPATALAALAGDFAVVLLCARPPRACGGSGGVHVIAARSRDARSAPPLFWGLDAGGAVVMLSTTAAGSLQPFPPGCYWETAPTPDAVGHPAGVLADYTRFSPSARAVTATPRVDSKGRLAALSYHSKSGKNLAVIGDCDDVV